MCCSGGGRDPRSVAPFAGRGDGETRDGLGAARGVVGDWVGCGLGNGRGRSLGRSIWSAWVGWYVYCALFSEGIGFRVYSLRWIFYMAHMLSLIFAAEREMK